MEFISHDLLNYCEIFTGPESPLLAELNRQTHLKVNQPRMLSGHLQGRLLSFLSKIAKPSRILEIGTYTGYSALCLAEGLIDAGKLITIDPNEETNRFARNYFNKSEYSTKIELLQGDALSLIPTLEHKWDLVFIDADKKNYANYYDLVIGNVNPGGLIIADNVLWSGKVLNKEMDKDTEAIHAFNKKTAGDARVESLLLPVRDGLMILRKK
ncbi:MAG: methyltransferase [Bacteroidetes bacterium]|jgi:predicted O-methyltransferase YrrM|nr:methyltransferase [Bacteroidota bacterium]